MPTARAPLFRGGNTWPLITLGFLAVGAVVGVVADDTNTRQTVWRIGLLLTGSPLVIRTAIGAFLGRFAADIVATLAIVVALVVQQPFVGLVIVLMQTGGEALERRAEGRASAAVRALEEAAPRIAHRIATGALIEDVPTDHVRVGDTLLVRPGELVPCDADVIDGRSHVDTSMLTGEPMPLSVVAGARLMSGSVNLEGALTIRATALARDSQYERIVELVRTAQESKAPLQRLADRYAVWFTPITIAMCIVTYLITGDPLRVLAVLAVATPCPLILATPVAILGGINRAATHQIIFRNGTALEQIGTTTIAVLDKTGTITIGKPCVGRVIPSLGIDEDQVLTLAAAVEQKSGHLLARTLVDHVTAHGVRLASAEHVVEHPGRGVEGIVDGRFVRVGARSFALERNPELLPDILDLEPPDEGLRAYIVVDGTLAGIVEYADEVRANVGETLRALRQLGIRRIMLLSGDRAAHAHSVASKVGIDEVKADLLPAEKVHEVRQLADSGERVLMVGDGTNDAPALSAATVGIALAGHGGGIAAEAANVVILRDDVARVVEAICIGRRTMRIARQSIWAGLGLSALAMFGAAGGAIAPATGALLQEGIDLAVILNALRASREAHGSNFGDLLTSWRRLSYGSVSQSNASS